MSPEPSRSWFETEYLLAISGAGARPRWRCSFRPCDGHSPNGRTELSGGETYRGQLRDGDHPWGRHPAVAPTYVRCLQIITSRLAGTPVDERGHALAQRMADSVRAQGCALCIHVPGDKAGRLRSRVNDSFDARVVA